LVVGKQIFVDGIDNDGYANGLRYIASVNTGNKTFTTQEQYYINSLSYVFTGTGIDVVQGENYTTNGTTFNVASTVVGGTSCRLTRFSGLAGNAPATTGTLTRTGTVTYTFTVTAANATAGAVYRNNGVDYTVTATIVGGTTLVTTATAGATTSGTTLTKQSGSGDATITFSARATADESISYSAFTSGGTGFTPALTVTGMTGGLIFGASKYGSVIRSSAGIAFATDGAYYSTFRDLGFASTGGTQAYPSYGSWGLLLDMRGGLLSTAPFVGSQGNKLDNCSFTTAYYGLDIGPTNGSQMSENMIENCHFLWNNTCIVNGRNNNYNCLQQTVVGGNLQTFNGNGIYVPYGSIPVIMGTGFQSQNNGTWDVLVANSAGDTVTMISCRSESQNVIYSNFQSICLIGALHLGPSQGTLAYCQSSYEIIDCYSLAGNINSWHGGCVRNSYFGLSGLNYSWITNDTGNGAPVYVERVMAGRTNIQAGADWWFTVSAANATVGATYTDGTYTFTVWATIAGGTTLKTTTTALNAQPPVLSGGTLTKTSGTGDATISFSQADPTGQFFGRGVIADNSGVMKFVGDKIGQWRSYTPPDIAYTKLVYADLPTAAGQWAGQQTYITDCNSSTRGATAAGGGANKVMVYCDGTNWIIM